MNKPLTFTDLMNFKYNDIMKHPYIEYYSQEPDGTLAISTREECFDFSDKSKRTRFFADPESGLCVRLADIGGKLETVCFAEQAKFAVRLARGDEPKDVVSVETCRDKNGECFVYEVPDKDADIIGDNEQAVFEAWVLSQLSVEARGLYRAVKSGYTANEYAELMVSKHPDIKPASVKRKYKRLLKELAEKVEKLRAEWDEQ
jgi:hypothetical protein